MTCLRGLPGRRRVQQQENGDALRQAARERDEVREERREEACVEEKRHPWQEQGMMIRQQLMYKGELESQGFDITKEQLWKKRGKVNCDIAIFVARLK